ncbi:MAG: fatty acyl-AMP ligase, partial [Myxococcota bacterium]|nr:fatty acyl-AMP ligase [Myxococcota bacterium]
MSIEYKWRSIVEMCRSRAEDRGGERALTFLNGDFDDGEATTYGGLDRDARAIATRLSEVTSPGSPVAIAARPGHGFVAAFLGCLYAGRVAVPLYPPTEKPLAERFGQIVRHAGIEVALVDGVLPEGADPRLSGINGVRWLNVAEALGAPVGAWEPPAIDANAVVMLQYTSGSTGAPKGVALSNGNLLDNSRLIHQAFGHSHQSSGVIWLPPYHDMGLIGGIIQPLYGGFPTALASPAAFMRRPLGWLKAISKWRATTSGGPNFAYDLCVRRLRDSAGAGLDLDLSCWEVAFCGAEPVRANTMREFAEVFKAHGFRAESLFPCYGLAESTLMVSGGPRGAGATFVSSHASGDRTSSESVLCGVVMPGCKAMIVEPESRSPAPADVVGELWLSGPSVARGYWQSNSETEARFGARLLDGSGPFLRTGDLGFMCDGQLCVAGRLTDVLVVHGVKHHPEDLEFALQASEPALRKGRTVVCALEAGQGQQIVVIQELGKTDIARGAAFADEIRSTVWRTSGLVVEEVVFVPRRAVPFTP